MGTTDRTSMPLSLWYLCVERVLRVAVGRGASPLASRASWARLRCGQGAAPPLLLGHPGIDDHADPGNPAGCVLEVLRGLALGQLTRPMSAGVARAAAAGPAGSRSARPREFAPRAWPWRCRPARLRIAAHPGWGRPGVGCGRAWRARVPPPAARCPR
eukprot:scaffold1871_cov112-Isochrysis_galbana.AAC.1